MVVPFPCTASPISKHSSSPAIIAQAYVDICPKVFDVRERTLLGIFDCRIDFFLCLLVNSLYRRSIELSNRSKKDQANLQAALIGHSPLQDVLLQSRNRVLLRAHLLDLVSRTVRRAGIRHPDAQQPSVKNR